MTRLAIALAPLFLVTGCGTPPTDDQSSDSAPPAGSSAETTEDETLPFSRIAPGDTVRFTGTEPFWGGQVAFTTLTYSTPENPDGEAIEVERFAGRGGLSWSGRFQDAPFTLAVTPGECSDGMSDRTYPYVATLEVQGEQRRGCAWTESDPFVGPPDAGVATEPPA